MVIRGYDYLFPGAGPFESPEPLLFRVLEPTFGMGCGGTTSWVTYRYPRPAVGLCSPGCRTKLDTIMKEGETP